MTKIEKNKIHCEDALKFLKHIPNKKIDMILCDLPYGTTKCKWDAIISFKLLWKEYKRITKDNSAIVLTASQPFTTDLINSNRDWFKYSMVWFKDRSTGFLNVKKRPLINHEDILVFYNKQPTYNPQRYLGNKIHSLGKTANTISKSKVYGNYVKKENTDNLKYPKTILYYPQPFPQIHNAQKPVSLFEYLIKTYTSKGDIVLDNCIGSGTTAVAALQLGRNFYACDNCQDYIDIARARVKEAKEQKRLF